MAWWMRRRRIQRRGKLAARRRWSGLPVLFLPLLLNGRGASYAYLESMVKGQAGQATEDSNSKLSGRRAGREMEERLIGFEGEHPLLGSLIL